MLHVERSSRADLVVARIADVLAQPLDDPLADEVVAVHSRGVERWLAQALARELGARTGHQDGVAAGIRFPFPHKLAREAVAAALAQPEEADPWHRDRLAWRVLDVVSAEGAPAYGPLTGADGDPRRLSGARHVAGLFGRYLAQRPQMLETWLDRSAEDLGADGWPLKARDAWQAELLRALVDGGLHDPVKAHAAAVTRLRSGEVELDLPERIAVVAFTAIPQRQLAAFAALAVHREVRLFLLHPSPVLWDAIAAAPRAEPKHEGWPLRRSLDATADLVRHPLLASWGRDARETQLTLPADAHHLDLEADPNAAAGEEAAQVSLVADLSLPLLQRLQRDIRRDADLPTDLEARAQLPRLTSRDRSVEVHDAHGDVRQVEVLRDVLLHVLDAQAKAGEEPIEPRDILVVCPDLTTFGPLVTAVLGEGAPAEAAPAEGTRQLRVRLADRAVTDVNPMLAVAVELLALAVGRRTSVEVIGLLSQAAVARRFDLDLDALDSLATWTAQTQVRWGLDADDRVAAGLPAIEAHTFADGLRRMALGLAMADEDLRIVDGVVPYDGVEGGDADLVGRFAEFLERLGDVLDTFATPMPLTSWVEALLGGVNDLAVPARGDEWQRAQLHRILHELDRDATVEDRPSAIDLSLEEVRSLLRRRLGGTPTRSGHRSGAVTVSTFVPLRGVPHRVIVLIGMDDGRFPRRVVADADDLLHRAPAVGDHEARAEDRQLLLDAVLAAEDRLVVIHAGRDVRTNATVPPAVPVTELRETIDRTVRPPTGAAPGASAAEHLTVRHHLHAHHRDYFRDGGTPGVTGAWSYDRPILAAARAGLDPARDVEPRLVTGPLAPHRPASADVLTLGEVEAFLTHPVRHFVQTRLEITLAGDRSDLATAMPTELDHLEQWQLGEALVTAWLDGQDAGEALEAARGRGLLPPGAHTDDVVAGVCETAAKIAGHAEHLGVAPGARTSQEVDVELPDGRRIVGVVPRTRGWDVQQVGYAKVGPRHRLLTWLRWLTLVAQQPDGAWRGVTVGRADWNKYDTESRVTDLRRLGNAPDVIRDAALAQLLTVVQLRDRGLDAAPPLYLKSSAQIAKAIAKGWDPEPRFTWTTKPNGRYENEDVDPYHLLVHGRQLPLHELMGEQPIGDEAQWPGAELGRAAAWATALWGPLLRVEREQNR